MKHCGTRPDLRSALVQFIKSVILSLSWHWDGNWVSLSLPVDPGNRSESSNIEVKQKNRSPKTSEYCTESGASPSLLRSSRVCLFIQDPQTLGELSIRMFRTILCRNASRFALNVIEAVLWSKATHKLPCTSKPDSSLSQLSYRSMFVTYQNTKKKKKKKFVKKFASPV
jgi:hypothetical protein